jgi:hypothetical protein
MAHRKTSDYGSKETECSNKVIKELEFENNSYEAGARNNIIDDSIYSKPSVDKELSLFHKNAVNNKLERKKTNMFDTPNKEVLDKSFEFVSVLEDDYLNLSKNDSFVLEMNDEIESNDKVDIFIKVKSLKETVSTFTPLRFKLFDFYKSCIEKK